MRLVAVGDVHPDRAKPEEVWGHVAGVFASADVRYCQLECTFSDRGVARPDVRNPAHRVSPRNIRALMAAPFDIVSFASNNALDYGLDAFEDTLDGLDTHGIAVVGAGRNLVEARRPVMIETAGARVAFVSACAILRDGYAATGTRPGIAPLHVRTFYEPLENIVEQPGTPARTWTFADPEDVDELVSNVREAKADADLVIACLHWGVHFIHDLAMYQPEVAYAAIDAGADLVIGTHPHCLQAFDVYDGKVIAYSLGNFVFDQSVLSTKGVSEYLSFYGIPMDTATPSVPHPKHTKLTGILVCDIEDHRIERVSIRPTLIEGDGQPRLLESSDTEFGEIAELVITLSAYLGTSVVVEEDELVIRSTKEEDVDARLLLQRRKFSYPSLLRLATDPR